MEGEGPFHLERFRSEHSCCPKLGSVSVGLITISVHWSVASACETYFRMSVSDWILPALFLHYRLKVLLPMRGTFYISGSSSINTDKLALFLEYRRTKTCSTGDILYLHLFSSPLSFIMYSVLGSASQPWM